MTEWPSYRPRLAQLRAARKLSSQETARRTGVYPETYSRYEHGKLNPSLPVLFQLLEVLECTPAQFFAPDPDWSRKP